MTEIDAKNIYYRDLNEKIRLTIRNGSKDILLKNVEGQRYIGGGIIDGKATINIDGVPGEDLAAFMDGPKIIVKNNAQNAVGNTMNEGKIVVHGLAGDVVGYGMRGGRIYVRDNVGYRVGIHMKGFKDKQPILVIGGKAGNFLGEYMAGGYLVVLGLTTRGLSPLSGDCPLVDDRPVVGDYCGTGMHGGTMYIRGHVEETKLGLEVKRFPLSDNDKGILEPILQDFMKEFNLKLNVFDFERYSKIIPVSTRPYGRLYVY